MNYSYIITKIHIVCNNNSKNSGKSAHILKTALAALPLARSLCAGRFSMKPAGKSHVGASRRLCCCSRPLKRRKPRPRSGAFRFGWPGDPRALRLPVAAKSPLRGRHRLQIGYNFTANGLAFIKVCVLNSCQIRRSTQSREGKHDPAYL